MAKTINKLNWQAVNTANRLETIERIKSVIQDCQGYITQFNMYSDLALSVVIEIEAENIPDLHSSFSTFLNITDLSPDVLKNRSKEMWFILMNVSFSKGQGKLSIEVPKVPG